MANEAFKRRLAGVGQWNVWHGCSPFARQLNFLMLNQIDRGANMVVFTGLLGLLFSTDSKRRFIMDYKCCLFFKRHPGVINIVLKSRFFVLDKFKKRGVISL